MSRASGSSIPTDASLVTEEFANSYLNRATNALTRVKNSRKEISKELGTVKNVLVDLYTSKRALVNVAGSTCRAYGVGNYDIANPDKFTDKEALDCLTQLKNKSESEEKQLSEKVAELDRERVKLRAEKDALVAKRDAEKNKLQAELQDQISKLNARETTTVAELKAKQQEISALNERIQALEAQNQKAAERIQLLESLNQKASKEVKEAKAAQQQCEQNLQELDRRVLSAQQEKTALENTLQSLRGELREKTSGIEKLNKTIADLTAEVAKLKDKLQRAPKTEDVQALERQIADTEKSQSDSNSKHAGAQQSNDQLQARIRKLEQELESANKSIATLDDERKAESTKLIAANKTLETETKAQQQDLIAAERILNQKEQELQSLKSKSSSQQDKINELNEQIADFVKTLQTADADYDATKAELLQVQGELAKFKELIRNFAQVATELEDSIPDLEQVPKTIRDLLEQAKTGRVLLSVDADVQKNILNRGKSVAFQQGTKGGD